MPAYSPLQRERLDYKPKLPKILHNLKHLSVNAVDSIGPMGPDGPKLMEMFPKTHTQPLMYFSENNVKKFNSLRVGVVFSGGQAAGGHNVIIGMYNALIQLNPNSRLFGFLGGPKGIFENRYAEINDESLKGFRNQGGFDLLGSGRDKIETVEQFKSTEKTVRELNLDGLVIIGGDDSNTNAALIAEYFLDNSIKTRVIGVPKTIDGDLKNEYVETSFGFDTACKTFSDTIGNIQRDALSAGKYYFFIKLMGRAASHVALECALEAHPNMTLISEEIGFKQKTLMQLTNEMADMICKRALHGKNHGVVLIPEGVIEFIPECQLLIQELNTLLAAGSEHQEKLAAMPFREEKIEYAMTLLSEQSKTCFAVIPPPIQAQLLLDRDPHGNVKVSKIETERLFIAMVKEELRKRKNEGSYQGSFSAQPLFLGYEGRSCLPSNFDCQYCYALGHVATLLIDSGATGYMSVIRNLARPTEEWQVGGIPLVPMMDIEERHGQYKPVIKKALVDLEGRPFSVFKGLRDKWAVEDHYLYPGPIQFAGPESLTDRFTLTLLYETEEKATLNV